MPEPATGSRGGVRAFLLGFAGAVVLAVPFAVVLHLLGVSAFAIGITIAIVFGVGGGLVGSYLSSRQDKR